MKYARVVNDVAVDVRDTNPDGAYTAEIAAQFIQVPDSVRNGHRLIDGTWTALSTEINEVIVPARAAIVKPIEFKLLFTSAERIAIKNARATDEVIDDWYTILDDPKLDRVDLGYNGTIMAVDHLVSVGIINGDRKEQILNAQLP